LTISKIYDIILNRKGVKLLLGNQLEIALRERNLINKPRKDRKPKLKVFNCKKCGEPMIRLENTNTMACSKCKNWYLFDFVK